MVKIVLKSIPGLWKSDKYFLLFFVVLALASSCTGDKTRGTNKNSGGITTNSGELTFYTVRYGTMEKQLISTFEERKGIKVNVVTDTPDALVERLENEGQKTAADVVLLDNLVDMYAVKAAGVLQPFSTDSVAHAMPSRNTDNEGYWAGFSKYAMGYGCNKVAVPRPSVINVYSDITGPYWKGRVILSKASNKENQFLVATMIAEQGEAATRSWLRGLINNLAIDPVENTEAVIRAVAVGQGDISFLNGSDYVRWTNSGNTENFETGTKVGVKIPYDSNMKSYYNLVSLGLTSNTRHRGEALLFIDYLISQKSQKYYCDLTFEYPVNVFTLPSDFILDIGGFSEIELDFSGAAANLERAKTLMKDAGWN